MIAALPMYDWPEVQGQCDAFWIVVRDHLRGAGVDAPGQLTRDRSGAAVWTDPGLLLGQTCGLPFVTGRCGDAVVVARPDYGLPGARNGDYCSILVCRKGAGTTLNQFRGSRGAVNEFGSQSGCHALADAAGTDTYFGSVVVSGSHRRSALMVADDKADIAAVDAVAWALFQQIEPGAAAALHVMDQTPSMPALPFITAKANTALIPDLRAALAAGCAAAMGAGLPVAVLDADATDYAPIQQMARSLRGRRLSNEAPSLPV